MCQRSALRMLCSTQHGGSGGRDRIRIQGRSISGPPGLSVRRTIRGDHLLLRKGRRQEDKREGCHDGQATRGKFVFDRLSFQITGLKNLVPILTSYLQMSTLLVQSSHKKYPRHDDVDISFCGDDRTVEQLRSENASVLSGQSPALRSR